jgi:hypothetical protein
MFGSPQHMLNIRTLEQNLLLSIQSTQRIPVLNTTAHMQDFSAQNVSTKKCLHTKRFHNINIMLDAVSLMPKRSIYNTGAKVYKSDTTC